MEMSWCGQVLYSGTAKGEVLRLDAPISFWGGISPENAEVILEKHPQRGVKITDKILIVPEPIGSSSSAAILLELLYSKNAPKGLILGTNKDAILPISVLVAEQMGWATIPIIAMENPSFKSGQELEIKSDGTISLCKS
tara:strand:- start:46 stop:462 length:417 start_codon:yes stop_codon:yes gene_type:complete